MEHVEDVQRAYGEIHRVLKPSGCYIFLTPNLFDYASIVSSLVPNRYHPTIVHWVEGRKPENTFPVFYRSNTKSHIKKLATQAGFKVEQLHYLGQYPNYLTFNRALFWIGCVYEAAISRIPPLHFLRGWILCVLRKKIPSEDWRSAGDHLVTTQSGEHVGGMPAS
jgi:SAM-dependent methyltransferase